LLQLFEIFEQLPFGTSHHTSFVIRHFPTRRLGIMNLALRRIEADFAPEHAPTSPRALSIAFQSPTRFLKAA